MKKQVYHEGKNYVLEYDNNSLIMYKEDIDEWMGDIEYIKGSCQTKRAWDGAGCFVASPYDKTLPIQVL